MLKILLIRPWVNTKVATVRNFLFGEPLGIECVATILKEQGHEVLLVDFMVEERGSMTKYLTSFQPNVVGITSQCTDVENVLHIAQITKTYCKEIAVIVGGVQAMIYPNSFFSEWVDYIFRMTTRANYKALMELIESKRTQTENIEGIYSRALHFENTIETCYNEYVRPDTECTKRYRRYYKYVGFQPCAVIQTSFGCRNRCSFCIRWRIEGPVLQEVDIEEVVDQIEHLDEPYVMICDNDFLIRKARLEKFCDLLEQKNIRKRYVCYGSVNSILEKPELFSRLRKNGLAAVIVGYESFDEAQLRSYNKASSADDNLVATRILQKNGIACWGSFILHPDWDKEDFKKLHAYKKLLRPELMSFSPLNPHPLTPLFEEYRDRLLYDETDYDKWNFGDVLIRPSKMSLRAYYFEVLKFTFGVNLNWHSLKYTVKEFPIQNTLRMLFGFNTILSVYIKNFLFRK